MRNIIYILFLIVLCFTQGYSQDHKYPVENFYSRSIALPIDYSNPEAGSFLQYYELTSNFDFKRPTVFFFQDIAQQYGAPGEIDKLAKEYGLFDNFNVVYYLIRGRDYSFIELRNPDGSVNWEKAYRVLSSDLVIEDIERIRKDLFKDNPDTKILVFGRSGGGFLIQRYLAKYSNYVQRAFIRAAPNSIIMKQLGNPESKYFYTTLNEIDTTLYTKLKTILKNNTVPKDQLLWILRSIPYASENPNGEMKLLINDLYNGNKETYQQYLGKKGFDFSKWIKTEKEMNQRDIGMYFCPLEVSADYMMNPDPEYIDPFYECMKKQCEPFIKLMKEKKVPIPTFPPLETFKEVETEVFYLAGRNDHVSDYRIGIELGKYFKHYELFIADDNHTMSIHKECEPLLRNAFFNYGLGSKELQSVRESLNCKEWKKE